MSFSLTRTIPAPVVVAPVATAVPIGVMAMAGFASGSGMRLLDPLLPQVADSLGVSVAAASVLVASFMLPYGLGQAVLGPLGDRLGKLRVVCVAVVMYGLFVLACAVASGLGTLVALRAVSGLFAGAIIPLMMAYLGDMVPYGERQATLGRFMTGMVMAQMLTGPISGVIGAHSGWRLSFVVLGVYAISIGIVLTARLGRQAWKVVPTAGATAVPGPVAYLRLLQRPAGRWLLISAFFDGLCMFGGAFPYIGAFLIQEFGLNAASAGLMVAGFGAGAFVYTRFARRLVRRFGETGLILLGGGGVSFGIIGLALSPNWQVATLMQVVVGLTFYMFHGVLQARATEAIPEARGTAVGAFALALFLGQGIGAMAFGGMLAISGYRTGFLAAGAAMLVLTVWCRAGLAVQPKLAEGT